jgi:hypothetical protein
MRAFDQIFPGGFEGKSLQRERGVVRCGAVQRVRVVLDQSAGLHPQSPRSALYVRDRRKQSPLTFFASE